MARGTVNLSSSRPLRVYRLFDRSFDCHVLAFKKQSCSPFVLHIFRMSSYANTAAATKAPTPPPLFAFNNIRNNAERSGRASGVRHTATEKAILTGSEAQKHCSTPPVTAQVLHGKHMQHALTKKPQKPLAISF